ncbi:MAG: hypothetical protein ACHQDF_01930 [Chitinophagales bacterium]
MDRKVAKNLLLISFAAETFFATYGLVLGSDASVASILYLIAGLGLVFSILFLPEARLEAGMKSEPGSVWIKVGLTAGMLLLAYITSRYWFNEIFVDPDYADMLPVIKVMNERFLSGHWKQVYDPIQDIWSGMMPGYLPAMWLPYSGALWLNLDMRWMTVLTILLSFGGFLFILRIKKKAFSTYLLTGIAGMLFWWIFSKDDIHGVISLSEEGPVILYYVLLCFAIVSGNIYFISLAVSLCLLSRYSMIGWVIPFLMFLASRKAFRQMLVFTLTGLFIFLMFFLIPFGTKPVWQLFHLPASYVPFASRVWTATPEVFWLNLGLAKFFGPQRTVILHQVLILGSFGVPVLFMLICLLQKKRKLNNVLLATLKLSLVLFYQFIDVPYGYLFYTSTFVSLVITVILLSQDHKREEEKDHSPDSSIQ